MLYIIHVNILHQISIYVSIPLHKQNLMERMPHITWYEIIIPLVQWTVTGLCRGFQLSLKSCRLTCFGHTCICTRRAEWIWIHHKIGNKQLAVLVSCKHEQWAVAIRQMALTVVYIKFHTGTQHVLCTKASIFPSCCKTYFEFYNLIWYFFIF